MFSRESELVNTFLDNKSLFLKKILGSSPNRTFCVTEFDSHFGVADIVLGTFQKYKRLSCNLDVKTSWFVPLYYLKMFEKFKIKDFSERIGYSVGYAKEIVNFYVKSGYVEKLDGAEYRVIREYDIVLDEIIAIEAKLKDWKRALQQAKRYKKFAKQSYVLLDESNISAALKNLDEFEKYNIGLISLSDEGLNVYLNSGREEKRITSPVVELNESAIKNRCI